MYQSCLPKATFSQLYFRNATYPCFSFSFLLSFSFFPVLVWASYLTDIGFWSSFKSNSSVAPSESFAHRVTAVSGGGLTAKQSKAIARQVQEALGSHGDAKAVEMIKLLALQTIKPSRAARRMEAIRSFTGGKRVLPSTRALSKSNETATVVAAQAHSPGPCVLQFKSDMYMVCEGDGRVFVVVRRSHAEGPCSVSYASVGGTATADVDYISVQGTLVFEDGELEKRIRIDIIDDDEPEDDEFFTVVLSEPSTECSLGEWHTTTVLIIDDDEPGDIGFDQACSEVCVLESKPFVELTARRFNGSKGRIECKYRTKDMNVPNAAKGGVSYVACEGVLVFEAQQMQQQIQVQLLDNEKFNRDEVFKVIGD
jgi:solute carrier family 8 (sodium/calcium exchanger)